MRARRIMLPAAWAVATSVAAIALAADGHSSPPAAGPFVRLRRGDDGQPVALESAIVRFAQPGKSDGGPVVDLVAAVHVGERSYYERLNHLFRRYDAVLYELVAPEGVDLSHRKPGTSTHPVSLLQRAMTRLMNLQFQLEAIDYSAPNFVHADMTAEQMAEAMRQRGESMVQIFLRMVMHAVAEQAAGAGSGDDIRLVVALLSRDRALAVKRILAEQMENLEGSLRVIEGPRGSTLISGRNKVALEVLRRQLARGHRRVAIFYGAGHMPDLAKRLARDFHLVPITTRWLVAWDLTANGTSPSAPSGSEKGQRGVDRRD